MEWLAAGDYVIAREILTRGVAAIYAIAFLSTLAQFPALLGERGLLPVPTLVPYLAKSGTPTIFRWGYTDRRLRILAGSGAIVAILLFIGVPQFLAPWLPMILFLGLWLAYLSIVTVGQTFYGFGWESLLLESGFVVAFLGAGDFAPPITIIFFIRWLVFRLEFGAGLIKMRGDRSWRDLTALYYHHETQPMPGPFSRYAHLLPKAVHRFEVLGNHFAQLVVPFFLFAPQPIASVAAAIVILTQLWLIATGNFAWLNVLTVVLACAAVSDSAFAFLGFEAASGPSSDPLWFAILVLLATGFLLVLSWRPARNLVSRTQLMNASFNRWHLVNAYGAFGSVTKARNEVIVEGTLSDTLDDQTQWREYEFKGKPGDPRRIPRQFAPYHLRLDWLMWFLALGSPDSGWFSVFLERLLEADPQTLRLLRVEPFGGQKPRWVRVRLYRYRFATRSERAEHHVWWIRHEVGTLIEPISQSAFGRLKND